MRTATKIFIFILLLMPVYLSGCIGEGDPNCDPLHQELTIQFLHNINPSYENTLPDVIEYINLYIYDESGEIAKYERLTKERLDTTAYKYKINLEAGTYTLIAIMNDEQEYKSEHTDSLKNASLRIICDDNQQLFSRTAPVFYGYDDKLYDNRYEEKQAVVTLDWYPVQRTINFANNTNNIEVNVKFNRYLLTGSEVEVYIQGKNGVIDFINKCPDQYPVYTYHAHEKEIENALTYQSYINRITTQRLWEGDDLELTIIRKEPGKEDEVMVCQPLTELLMKNPLYNNDYQLERYNDYQLVYEYEFRDGAWMLSELLINDWKTIQQPAEL